MRKYLASIAVLMALSGCQSSAQTPPTPPTTQTAALQQKVLAAEVAYEAPLAAAIAYNKLPRCTAPKTVVLCSEPAVVDKLRTANHDVIRAFDAAMTIASTPGVSESAVTAAIVTATNLVGVLQDVLSQTK